MAEPLWTWAELVAATGGVAEGAAASGVMGVSIDTRTLQPGDLFVALKGDNQDGHVYVTRAFEKHAGAALVSADYVRPAGVGPLVRVSDQAGDPKADPVLVALGKLGVAARARLGDDARIIAVTGSVGKTSTKEMLRVCLSSVDPRTHASDKSYNNHWGVPLTLARMPRDTRFGVFEIGMNHPGEIRPLSRMVRPHVAIITTVGPVHLGFFKSVEEIADAKAEIFAGLEAPPSKAGGTPSPQPSPQRGEGVKASGTQGSIVPSPRWGEGQDEGEAGGSELPRGGVAVLCTDSPYFDRLRSAAIAAGAQLILFGGLFNKFGIKPDFWFDKSSTLFSGQTEFDVHFGNAKYNIQLAAPGEHQIKNAMGVFAILQVLNVDFERAITPLQHFKAATGRGARDSFTLPNGPVVLIDESYNANPVSMRSALDAMWKPSIFDPSVKRRIAVLGDMRELGDASDQLHRELIGPIRNAGIDKVFACGPHMAALRDELVREGVAVVHRDRSDDLIGPLLQTDEIRPGDVIMVKGSLGTRMAPIVDALKKHLTEWEKQK